MRMRRDDHPALEATSSMPIRVRRVTGQIPEYFRLLGPFQGYWVHYVRNRSRACVVPREDCEWCQRHERLQWQGYAPALWYNRLANVPEAEKWEPAIPEVSGNCRELGGLPIKDNVLELCRGGKKKSAILLYKFVGWKLPLPTNFKPFPIDDLIERFYGFPGRQLHVAHVDYCESGNDGRKEGAA